MFALLYGLKSVSPAALRQAQQDGTVTVFDMNARPRWEQVHVPGARHLALAFDAADLPADRGAPLVF